MSCSLPGCQLWVGIAVVVDVSYLEVHRYGGLCVAHARTIAGTHVECWGVGLVLLTSSLQERLCWSQICSASGDMHDLRLRSGKRNIQVFFLWFCLCVACLFLALALRPLLPAPSVPSAPSSSRCHVIPCTSCRAFGVDADIFVGAGCVNNTDGGKRSFPRTTAATAPWCSCTRCRATEGVCLCVCIQILGFHLDDKRQKSCFVYLGSSYRKRGRIIP